MSNGKASRQGGSRPSPDSNDAQDAPSRPFSLPPGYYEYYGIPLPRGAVQTKRSLYPGRPLPHGYLEYYGIVERAPSNEEVKSDISPAAAASASIKKGLVEAKSDESGAKSENASEHLPRENSTSVTLDDAVQSSADQGFQPPPEIQTLQRKEASDMAHPQPIASLAAPVFNLPSVGEVISTGGQPLDSAVRSTLEPRFGHDFSAVRIHTDKQAACSAAALNAEAYTVADHIVFGEGRYAPGSTAGQHLLAHELTHVVQQGGARGADTIQRAAFPVQGHQASAIQQEFIDLIGRIEQVLLFARERLLGHGGLPSQDASWVQSEGTVSPTLPKGAGQDKPPAVLDACLGAGVKLPNVASDQKIISQEDADHYLAGAAQTLVRLRGIVSSGDEPTMRQVLLGFTMNRLLELDRQVMAGAANPQQAGDGNTGATGTMLREQRPVAPAMRSLTVSVPSDAAEIEAEQVAAAVTAGATLTHKPAGTNAKVSRQIGEALTAAGTAFLTADAEAEPTEVAAGPPGWIVAAGLAVVGVALLGAGYLVSSRVRERAEPRVIPRTRTREDPPAAMRFQVQWNTNRGGPTFSNVATAPAEIGVSTMEAITTLTATVAMVTPGSAYEAAAPAAAAQAAWIRSRPPGGIGVGGYSHSEYFVYRGYRDARVDVENLRGHNLRI